MNYDRRAMESLLAKPSGQVTVLVVGGAPEALNSDQVHHSLVFVFVFLSLLSCFFPGVPEAFNSDPLLA